MEKNKTISDLYIEALKTREMIERSNAFLVLSFSLDEYDEFELRLYKDKGHFNLERIYTEKVGKITKNITEGFMAIGQIIGFVEGYNVTQEVDFGPLEPVKQARQALDSATKGGE